MFSEGTNSSKLDLGEYFGGAENYIIASTPRCGSTLLGQLLWRSNLAGAPHEYFHPMHAKDYYERWSVDSIDDYVELLKRWRTTKNGIFGVKLHYYQIAEFGVNYDDISRLLDKPKYIFIRRKTKIRQAISLVRAQQTNQYAVHDASDVKEGDYNFESIRDQFFRLINEENQWAAYFKEHQISPLEVWYEDLAQNYAHTLEQVFKFLSIDYDSDDLSTEPTIKKMSDSLTEEWVVQFNKDMETYQSVDVV